MPALDVAGPRPRSASAGFVLLIGLLLLVAAGKAILFDTIDPDCFWHLKVAEQLRIDGIRPLVDKLSFASLQGRWTPYSWLAELAMKWVWDTGGFRLAVAVQAIMQGAFVIAAALACRAARPALSEHARFLPGPVAGSEPFHRRAQFSAARRANQSNLSAPFASHAADEERADASPSRLAAVLATAFCGFISLPYLSFRPVTAALVLLGLCAWLLVRDRASGERSRAIWWIPVLTALMVNLHLYAIFVPVWVSALWAGAFWERCRITLPAERPEAERRAARYLILMTVSAMACCATPMLAGMIDVALHYQYEDPMVASGYLSEMWPFFHGTLGAVSGALVVLALLCIAINFRNFRAGEFLWLAGSVLILSRMGRFAPVFALVAAPMFAISLPRLSDRVLTRPPVWATALVVLSLGIWRTACAFPSAARPMSAWLNRHVPDGPGYPCAAADWVAASVQSHRGRLISEFSWGGYLEWRLGDRYQLLLDGRTQLFSPEFWRATYLCGPKERLHFLSQIRADAAILPLGTSIFRAPLLRLGWRPAWHDDQSEVLLPPPEQMADDGAGGWSIVESLFPGR